MKDKPKLISYITVFVVGIFIALSAFAIQQPDIPNFTAVVVVTIGIAVMMTGASLIWTTNWQTNEVTTITSKGEKE